MSVKSEFHAILDTAGIVPVISVSDAKQVAPLVQALFNGGLRVFEFTLRHPSAMQALKQACETFPNEIIGAGSVRTPEQFDEAVNAGAQFIVSPGSTPALIAHAKQQSVPWLPGAATASEMMTLWDAGFCYLKFFPAEANGGAAALKAISAPLGELRFCPTGGINPQNLHAYLGLTCVACVGGSWMLPQNLIDEGDWQGITALTEQALNLAKSLPQAN